MSMKLSKNHTLLTTTRSSIWQMDYSATYTKPQSHTQPMSSEFAQNVNTHSDNMSLPQEQQHQFAVSNLQSQRDLANAQRDAALFQLQLNREALAFYINTYVYI